MKKVYYLIAACTILFSCNINGNDHQSISIKNTNDGFNLEASFNERKTEKIVEYLEKTLNDDKIFTAASDVKDGEVNLGDSVKFYLKSSPGNLEIDFKKQYNSEPSYKKLVKMCNGIKDVLK